MKVTVKTRLKTIEVEAGEGSRLDDAILSTGVLFDRPCGGRGICGKCAVKAEGKLSPPTAAERETVEKGKLGEDERLACQALIAGDAIVSIDTSVIFTDKTFKIEEDLEEIPGPFGLAMDLGTTTVAAFLVDLESGRVMAGNAVQNRQTAKGAEVMSRLLAAEDDPEALKELAWQSMIEAAGGLGLSDRSAAKVEKAVVAGNSAMHHLALGIPVGSLLRSPFEPARLETMETTDNGLAEIFPNLRKVIFAPLIGGFVGSDALACALYFGLNGPSGDTLIIDLGTNGEVILQGNGKILAASTAAGPAFEGVNVSCGMRAMPGAVTGAEIDDNGKVIFRTIGDAPARGIAGSGLLSLVRGLRMKEAIGENGRIAIPGDVENFEIAEADDCRRIELGGGLFISQDDVRELQKAKGAVRAAIEIMLSKAGASAKDFSRVILTGGFGGRIDPADVVALGVIPETPLSRISSIPNGAGLGAAMMLDPENLTLAEKTARSIEHIELNLDPGFMDRYVTGMSLKLEPVSEDAL